MFLEFYAKKDKYPLIVKAFEKFAGSKVGIKFLSNYAEAGQTVAGHKYLKNGKYHDKKIDLVFTAERYNEKRW